MLCRLRRRGLWLRRHCRGDRHLRRLRWLRWLGVNRPARGTEIVICSPAPDASPRLRGLGFLRRGQLNARSLCCRRQRIDKGLLWGHRGLILRRRNARSDRDGSGPLISTRARTLRGRRSRLRGNSRDTWCLRRFGTRRRRAGLTGIAGGQRFGLTGSGRYRRLCLCGTGSCLPWHRQLGGGRLTACRRTGCLTRQSRNWRCAQSRAVLLWCRARLTGRARNRWWRQRNRQRLNPAGRWRVACRRLCGTWLRRGRLRRRLLSGHQLIVLWCVFTKNAIVNLLATSRLPGRLRRRRLLRLNLSGLLGRNHYRHVSATACR